MKFPLMSTLFALLYASGTCVIITPPTTFKLAGAIPPLGYFDPLGVTATMNESKLKYMRESELQHGRVAMLSFVTLVGLDATSSTPSIDQLSDLEWERQIPYWLGVGALEFARLSAGWVSPFEPEGKLFQLEETYQPGNIFNVPEGSYDENKLNTELSNGRLAMIGCGGYIAQEFVTHAKIFA